MRCMRAAAVLGIQLSSDNSPRSGLFYLAVYNKNCLSNKHW